MRCAAPVPALLLALALASLGACAAHGPQAADVEPQPPAEARSLLGAPLLRPALEPATRARLEQDLERAQERLERHPELEDAWVWAGRRLGYLGRYRDAVATFDAGLERFPESARLLRHRGHRRITLRDLRGAVLDLQRAEALLQDQPDALEPDGAPNAYGVPRSTLRSNVLYHLGLAQWLRGDLELARAAFVRALEPSRVNDDMLCATSYWLWLALARLGRDTEAAQVLAPVADGMDVLENRDYLELLLLFRGERTEAQLLDGLAPGSVAHATRGFGVGAWHLVAGREARARELFEQVVAAGAWPAFGCLAAEAELARAR